MLRSPLIVSDSRATAGTALPYHSYNFSFFAPDLNFFLGYVKTKRKGLAVALLISKLAFIDCFFSFLLSRLLICLPFFFSY